MIKDIKAFEEILKKSLAKEYDTDYEEVEVTITNGMYDLAATEIEDEDDLEFHNHMQETVFELKFDPVGMNLVWFKDGKETAREDYAEDEIIEQLNAGGYFDLVLKYEDCDAEDECEE
ncbi:MAG: hypothetical protein ACRCXX_14410 [Cetobacterium sp.]|uniref:hypothetical protein n=1 Tax=Cetobacterium sp. TaxID=2071632 RepID=UPI003F409536